MLNELKNYPAGPAYADSHPSQPLYRSLYPWLRWRVWVRVTRPHCSNRLIHNNWKPLRVCDGFLCLSNRRSR